MRRVYKQSPGNVTVYVRRRSLQQRFETNVEVIVLLARRDRCVEQLLEVLQGELVHRVDLGHVGDDEVHDGAARGDDTVLLAGGADLLLRRLRLLQPLRDDA